jgi:hypothetical protein
VHLFKTDHSSHVRLRLFERDGKVDSLAIADDGSIDGSKAALALARFSDEKAPLTLAELRRRGTEPARPGLLQAMLAH